MRVSPFIVLYAVRIGDKTLSICGKTGAERDLKCVWGAEIWYQIQYIAKLPFRKVFFST